MSVALADRVAARAAGALHGQRHAHDLREGRVVPSDTIPRLQEVIAAYGYEGEFGFVGELAKAIR